MATAASQFQPGALVKARGRDWVVISSDEDGLVRLRPVDGVDDDAVGVYLPLEEDAIEPSRYPPPNPTLAGNLTSALLLRDAVRLTLRSGAGPFRSIGRLSVEPRPYQYVPLIMALRMNPVRLLIADDVGIGKTIESAMIARELLDRGLARRLAVICPPHLCYQVEEQEVEAELIGKDANQRMMFWESAEGGTGVWETMMDEPDAFSDLARYALELCHFDPDTGAEVETAEADACTAACYQCLLSYSNQQQHRYVDRREINDFLLKLSSGTAVELAAGRDREEQYEWLKERTDPASGLEIPFLDFLYQGGFRLPNVAQNRPSSEVASQPDFYYERDGVPGACIFVDGSDHLDPAQQERDASARTALEDRGYRVITIRFDRPREEQVARHSDVFGIGTRS